MGEIGCAGMMTITVLKRNAPANLGDDFLHVQHARGFESGEGGAMLHCMRRAFPWQAREWAQRIASVALTAREAFGIWGS